MNTILKANIWEKSEYYQHIARGERYSHPGFIKTQEYCRQVKSILDLGCGDGTKLAILGNSQTYKLGMDVSKKAIRIAREKNPKFDFKVYDGKILPIRDRVFEIVTSFFVLEHLDNPEDYICEAIRVVKTGGLLFFLAPNFGAPNRASPNFDGSRLIKLLVGITADFLGYGRKLSWSRVQPPYFSMTEFERDLDTTVEPYVLSLEKYLSNKGLTMIEKSSYWKLESKKAKLIQRLFRILGEKAIFPFNNWGPHLFIIAQKR